MKVPNQLEIKSKPYKVGVGGSMYIHIMPNGSKYWRMAYRFYQKQKTFAIGTHPDISLLEAENIRDKAKALIKDGIDPVVINSKEDTLVPVIEADAPKPQANIEQASFQVIRFREKSILYTAYTSPLNLDSNRSRWPNHAMWQECLKVSLRGALPLYI